MTRTYDSNTDRENDARGRTPQCDGSGIRMLMYSHDTFGLGHLRRSLRIAGALLSRFPKLALLLATGSPVVHRFTMPTGLDYVKLPAVRKIGPEKYEARTLAMPYQQILQLRTNLLLQTVKDYLPHVLLVDHSPAGMRGEMIPALQWLRENNQQCRTVIGLRDIIDDPATVCDLWEEGGIYDLLLKVYDHILIYGSPEVYPTASKYNFQPELESKTSYCQYIGEPGIAERQVGSRDTDTEGLPLVVVTIGGGDGAGELVIGNYLDMLHVYCDEVDFNSILLPGPFIEPDLLKEFERRCIDLPATIEPFVDPVSPLIEKSSIVISTGGYNSVTQILSHARQALIIPRVMHRHEQLLRAQRMAELGWTGYLHPDDVSPKELYIRVRTMISDSSEPLTQVRTENRQLLTGTDRVADFCGSLFESIASEEVSPDA